MSKQNKEVSYKSLTITQLENELKRETYKSKYRKIQR